MDLVFDCMSLSREFDESNDVASLCLKEVHVVRGMLNPASLKSFEIFVGLSAAIPSWIRVAVGGNRLSGVTSGECLDSYAQPSEALADPCFQS